jgi:hypothetical protein
MSTQVGRRSALTGSAGLPDTHRADASSAHACMRACTGPHPAGKGRQAGIAGRRTPTPNGVSKPQLLMLLCCCCCRG